MTKAYAKLLERTDADDYAVTHMIPITGLAEGKDYYIRISASDSENFTNVKTISDWGDENEPISVLAVGETTSTCFTQNQNKTENNINIPQSIVSTTARGCATLINNGNTEGNNSLEILSVQNENYLQPNNKVQTIISWKTNIPATTVLLYREGNSNNTKELDANDQKTNKTCSSSDYPENRNSVLF